MKQILIAISILSGLLSCISIHGMQVTTPANSLMVAVLCHHDEMVMRVTQENIDPNIKCSNLDNQLLIPLDMAKIYQNKRIIRILNTYHRQYQKKCLNYPTTTPLMVAVICSDPLIVDRLIKEGADPNKECLNQRNLLITPLDQAKTDTNDHVSNILQPYHRQWLIERISPFVAPAPIADLCASYLAPDKTEQQVSLSEYTQYLLKNPKKYPHNISTGRLQEIDEHLSRPRVSYLSFYQYQMELMQR